MTALVSIETATGRCRRYTRWGKGSEMRNTHDVPCDNAEAWQAYLRGYGELDLASLEQFRLGGIEDGEVA